MFASMLLTVSLAAGADFPVYWTHHDTFFWNGPTKHTCFPCSSPFFGYNPTSWRPWPFPTMVPPDCQAGVPGMIYQSLPPVQSLPADNLEPHRELLPEPRPEQKGL